MKTETNWAQMLGALRKKSPRGFTSEEFADEAGCSVASARTKMAKLCKMGHLKFAGNRPITRMDGRAGVVPVYAQSGTEKK